MLTHQRATSLAIILFMLALLLLRFPPRPGTQNSGNGRPLSARLALAFPYDPAVDVPRIIWQTWRYSPKQDEFDLAFRHSESSWTALNPGYEHEIITDEAASLLIARLYSRIREVPEAFEALPEPVLKADFFRYLILLAHGGIYSDIDTTVLKPVADWVPADMQPYGLVVGIEADPDRPDWQDWYARRIQFCQWTIASKPGHPVLVEVVAAITSETLSRQARDELDYEHMKTVMEFTGPGIWTDTLFNFFNNPSYDDGVAAQPRNITWEQFAKLRQPMKERDVVVLPITSFSPGVGHMGSGSSSDPLAFVRHGFSGTWKHDERGR